ncbi:variant erythrocyte surface antigen-1 family protein [Babesia caballi]|uniref:Variant erythrocyte surface antigen-1 family protein n=1 Tax=Babesia caballi TaxID=5871 RepID=A0AAV4LSX7_BABCB|nr:variant erythrocyte surface antigen-1 family protein [Babesia caballi]
MGDGQKTSLTDPPTNLKEAIDWLALVGGGFGGSGCGNTGMYGELANEFEKLPDFNVAKGKVLGRFHPSSFIKNVADKLGKGFLGYEAQGVYAFNVKGIVKNGEQYQSSYHNANWEQSNASTYAKIFSVPFMLSFLLCHLPLLDV